MTSSRQRIAAALVLLFTLSAPLAAQPAQEGRDFGSVLTHLWTHWASEIAGLWTVATLDGRGGCDPNGLVACGPSALDGRGGCDPDGLVACGPAS